MKVVDTVTTDCGFVLAVDGTAVYALTPCCREAADWAGRCGCGREMREGYAYAALVGSKYYRRDLRTLLESLGCEDPGECATDVATRVENLLTAGAGMRMVVS